MRDYHTDRGRGVYITGAGWSRSTFIPTDVFRYAWESWMQKWDSDENKETNTKGIEAADSDKIDEFLS